MMCASARADQYAVLRPDSLPSYANVFVLASAAPVSEDSAFCDVLEPAGEDKLPVVGKVSVYTCRERRDGKEVAAKVGQFTVASQADGFTHMLFKPAGTDKPYFQKVKFKTADLEQAYEAVNPESSSKRRGEHGDGFGAGLGTILLLAALITAIIFFTSSN